MLNKVPAAVNRLARNVVMNHPNTYNCQVFRKTVTRDPELDTLGVPMTMGGLGTVGGLGVMETDDDEKFDYAWVGNGFALPAEGFASSQMMERADANNGTAGEMRFLIEPEIELPLLGGFLPVKNDVIYLLLGPDPLTSPKLAYEVVGIETTVNIPPYTHRYICNRRDDLHVVGY